MSAHTPSHSWSVEGAGGLGDTPRHTGVVGFVSLRSARALAQPDWGAWMRRPFAGIGCCPGDGSARTGREPGHGHGGCVGPVEAVGMGGHGLLVVAAIVIEVHHTHRANQLRWGQPASSCARPRINWRTRWVRSGDGRRNDSGCTTRLRCRCAGTRPRTSWWTTGWSSAAAVPAAMPGPSTCPARSTRS